MSVTFESFDYDGAISINHARREHFKTLGLEINDRQVLNVGCGVRDDLIRPFIDANCSVVSIDARKENVDEFMRRNLGSNAFTININDENAFDSLGKFDIVFCYGLLYHLNNPRQAINNMYDVCNEFLVVESMVYHVDNDSLNSTDENQTIVNQSFDGLGCRPARTYLFNELKKFFPFVYYTKTQPVHEEFPTKWPVSSNTSIRCIFVASKQAMSNPNLTDILPSEYAHAHVHAH